LETKTTVYLSIIATCFFVSCLIPLTVLLGQPLSLLMLAYFKPWIKKKIVIGVLVALFLANSTIGISSVLTTINFVQNIFSILGIPNIIAIVGVLSASFLGAYILGFKLADKLITKAKLRNRAIQH